MLLPVIFDHDISLLQVLERKLVVVFLATSYEYITDDLVVQSYVQIRVSTAVDAITRLLESFDAVSHL